MAGKRIKGEKVAVTGANGFVGSAICEKLLENKFNRTTISMNINIFEKFRKILVQWKKAIIS